MRKKLSEKPWYKYAAALCIGVAFYVLLTHQSLVLKAMRTVFGYFAPVFLGLVLAYLMNPLFRLFQNRVFAWIKHERFRHALALVLTVLIVLAFFGLLIWLLIPQLVSSIMLYIENLDDYVKFADSIVSKVGISIKSVDLHALSQKAVDYIKSNSGEIFNTTVSAGKSVGGFVLSFLLAIYMLAAKDKLKSGAKKLLGLILPQKRYDGMLLFLDRSDDVLVRYIVFSLLESLIVAGTNAIFMLVTGMSYAPLVSFVVGVTNLIPTVGPFIGAGIGAFILVLVKPSYALWFLIFTVILQLVDGYILKPRLFGNSLGISGVWVLIAIVVGGKMFGIVGMLVAIPCTAILIDLYKNYFIPWLERRKAKKAPKTEPQEELREEREEGVSP